MVREAQLKGGPSYYKMGRFAEAEENLLHAVTLWPDET